VIPSNHPDIVYSPYNWNVGASAAVTINAGAYLRTMFSGTSCVLNFNVANNLSPLSEIWYRIDGEGPWIQAAVASAITCAMPAATLSNSDIPYHLLEMVVKSTTETQNRWNMPSATAVNFTGLTLAPGGVVLTPLTRPINILIYGDSITEGVRTLGESAANDTDRNDAMLGWAFRLGDLLGAEVGVVGFGASGIAAWGSGNVPALPSSYALLYQGAARSFLPTPALVVFNEGTNDGTANTVAGMTSVLNGVIAACPGAVIAVLRPFNGNQAANLQAAIAGCVNPSVCHYIDTTGVFDTTKGSDSLYLHPSGTNNLGLIAPNLAALLRPLLVGGQMPTFHGGFQRGLLG
jgi:lysophospholipase L1-like esterase